MQPAARYGALLVKTVQKPLCTRLTGGQQIAWASTAVRLSDSRACQAKTKKDQASRQSCSQWTRQHSISERTFSTSARRWDGVNKDEKEQPTIHLQPPPPTPDVEEKPILPEQSEPTEPQPQQDQDMKPTPTEPPTPTTPPPRAADQPLSTPASSSPSLPSAFAHRRTEISRRMSHMMDNLLTKANLASQQINTYTGTDFSGIEALRTEIVAQEKEVKLRHAAVNTQKDRHMEAHVKQASSQKEIVSLLERKSSWSPSDLERYMTLVRSEHLDEQAVQKAKEDLAEAERDLEDTRAMLEKLERKQYHEEQIWSDTIRRNSTWVTMGLMGVNIFLLLAQIIFFEPYRRRKIVREMKAALDERSMVGPGLVQTAAAPEIVAQTEQAEAPKAVPVEVVETEAKVEPVPLVEQPVETVSPVEAVAESIEAVSVEVDEPIKAVPAEVDEAVLIGDIVPDEVVSQSTWKQLEQATSWEQRLEISKATVLNLFSDRLVHLKQVDVTTIALQGAATGIASMGILFLLLRPN
jgi:sensitive to high expression protein 9